VLTAAIAKNPKIDVIVSDFGPSLVGALPVFTQSGRSIPAIATSDGNVLSCFWEENKAANPDFKLMTISTQNDHSRLAIQHAVARATGGEIPKDDVYPSTAFEDSVTSSPNPVTCEKDLPGDIYLSAEMPGDKQAEVIK
jgi:ribose transport system substrate-binding protein